MAEAPRVTRLSLKRWLYRGGMDRLLAVVFYSACGWKLSHHDTLAAIFFLVAAGQCDTTRVERKIVTRVTRRVRRLLRDAGVTSEQEPSLDCWCAPEYRIACDDCTGGGCWQCSGGWITIPRERAEHAEEHVYIVHRH